jgi:hypothetical protein
MCEAKQLDESKLEKEKNRKENDNKTNMKKLCDGDIKALRRDL